MRLFGRQLSIALGCLTSAAAPLAAQGPPPAADISAAAPERTAGAAAPDTAALEFHGFRASETLADLAAHLHALGGTSLHCRRAHADRRITECRGRLADSSFGGAVDVWVSAVDSAVSVLTLSGSVDPAQLDAWRSDLEASYGRVGATVQGPQWMMQWVRRGRMIRLTWRLTQGAKVASVALVDGRVLDAWGRDRARR
ncbi:MAG TPA: hypothetical protein VFW66_10250 [Gemmatimonadales bacterium]|nr:hypothetical protein [Gemmatimonadales bacterium]